MEYLEFIYKHWIITSILLFLFPFRYGSIFKFGPFKIDKREIKKD